MLLIKPHHFIDIIKLYGAGLDIFVPDVSYGHAFYSVANEIMENHNIRLQLTVSNDDICIPCKYANDNMCTDRISHIAGYDSKDTYNKVLDNRLIDLIGLSVNTEYTAYELCNILYQHRELIFDVWKEEPDDITQKRYALFTKGCERYLTNLPNQET